MQELNAPSVSIDGQRVRLIREKGRLTQLYVAKVVGVTTDTVSRWENNRYPTIRRDNALKLAEALEVSLDSILKQKIAEVSGEPESGVRKGRSPRLYLALTALLIVVVVLITFFYLKPEPVPKGFIEGARYVPKYAAPGTRVPIHLEISSQAKLKGLIVHEVFPRGWKLVESDPPASSVDNLNGSVRWMLRKPSLKKQIVYVLQVPKTALGSEIAIRGEAVATLRGQSLSAQIASNADLQIQPFHWADKDGDGVIEDLEILDVSDLVDISEKIHYDWDLIEQIWDAGGYEFNPESQRFKTKKMSSEADAR